METNLRGAGGDAGQRAAAQRPVQQISGTAHQHPLQHLAEPGDAAEDQQDADADGGDGGPFARQEGHQTIDEGEGRGEQRLHEVHSLHRHVGGARQQVGQRLGALLQQAEHQFQRQEDEHRQQVEEVPSVE